MPVRAFSIEDGNLGSKTILTSRTKVSKDIDLSFAKKPSGDVFKKTDAAAVKQAVKNLLLTNFSEKPFLPRFGGNLNSLLFALNTDIDDEDLEEQIINAIEIYEPRARVTNISSNVNDDQHQVKVTVTFRIVNTNETVTTNIDLTRLR
jgi:phage baseplate assembly protein W|tara:strand:- start:950 stop:1393 length:444 start_codon:yes stop_codon:yes gene_type:complete